MKRPATLNARFVETVNRPGRYGDGHGGHGLSLLVKPMANGRLSKSWAQRVRIDGRATNIGLGSYPVVTLARARRFALENRRDILDGIDPRAGDVPTFAAAVDKVIAMHAENWKDGGKTEAQWRATLATYAFPRIGRKSVADITTADVLAVLVPVWNKKPETARKVRQRIGTVMKWAIAKGHRGDNPAGEAIGAALPKIGDKRKHFRALPYADVSDALSRVRESGAWWATKAAFELLVLTAARSGEVRGATVDEIDLNAAVWTVPGERTKTGRAHRVPLSPRALDVLAKAAGHRDDSGGGGLVFPSPRGLQLSDMTLSKLLKELHIDAVPHGFRSSFRDWAAERTNIPREICEHALAHVVGDAAELAYRRTDYFEKRRDLMDRWAAYLTRSIAAVVAIR